MDKTLRRNRFSVLLSMMALAASAARADEVTIVSDVPGPEGPLFVDRALYYVGWVSNTLSKWDGKTATKTSCRPRSQERFSTFPRARKKGLKSHEILTTQTASVYLRIRRP